MATVLLASDRKHRRPVAIKIFEQDLMRYVGPERFLREIEVVAQLDHPHIVPLLDSGEVDGLLYYVMPYVDGETLRERLVRERQIGQADALRIAREVGDALDYAHRHGIVHRDVKPENILLSNGHARVTDFGIARAVTLSERKRITETGITLGTPGYMSPEQVDGAEEIDGRSDLYSLGCVMFEMLAGEPPHLGKTAHAIFARQMRERPPDVSVLRPTVPANVATALNRALATSPSDRFPTVAAFLGALDAPTVVAPSPRQRAKRVALRWLAAALGLSLITLGTYRWFASDTYARTPITRLAVLPFENEKGDLEQDYFVQAQHEALIAGLTRAHVPVIARSSVMRYAKTSRSVGEIARDLGVNGLVEGSIHRKGDSVSIALRLVDPTTKKSRWSQSYAEDVKNILHLQQRMARAIAEQTGFASMTAGESPAMATKAVDPVAYDAYLKGRFYAYRLTQRDLQLAVSHFERALASQPDYANAYSGIAFAWAAQGYLGFVPPSTAYSKANAAIMRAIVVNDSLAEAHDMLARIEFYYGFDWPGAERQFRRALALDPSSPDTHSYFGLYLTWMGRTEEAKAELDRALELDPLNPLFLFHRALHRLLNGSGGDADIEAFQNALGSLPDFPWYHHWLWLAFQRASRYPEAAGEARVFLGALGFSPAVAQFRQVHDQAAYRAVMARVAVALAADSSIARNHPAWIADFYAQAAMNQKALLWLWTARANADPFLVSLGVGFPWDGLRSEPRFMQLVREMKFPIVRGS
jgi:serine/threonine-protein kinase